MKGLDRVLYTLRDHPWASSSHVAGLTQIPLRSVQRYLSKLASDGLVQRQRVPLVRGWLYAPSVDGIIQMAGGKRRARRYANAFYLDAYHLAGSLLRSHSLIQARDFLVSLTDEGSMQWSVSPWEARVNRRLLNLDAYGCASWMGKYHRFAIIVDPGSLAVEGYKQVFKQFARWADKAFDWRDGRPNLLMLTTYMRRAYQLAVLWHETIGRTVKDLGVEIFVAVAAEVAADPAGQDGVDREERTLMHEDEAVGGSGVRSGRWWRGKTGDQGPLWKGCYGQEEIIPRPWPSLVRSRRSGKVQDVGKWASRGERGRRAHLRAFLDLSGKDWKVLKQVARWPFLKSVELALLGGYSSTGAGMIAQSLNALEEKALIRSVQDEDAQRRRLELQRAQLQGRLAETDDDVETVNLMQRLLRVEDELAQFAGGEGDSDGVSRYALAHSGLGLLAATRGIPPLAYGRARLWPVKHVDKGGKRVVDFSISSYLLAWQHTVLTIEFFLGLRRLAEEQWYGMHRNHHLLVWDSVECRRWFYTSRGRRLLVPDSGGVYQIGEETYNFWLEMDRGHSEAGKHGQVLRRKYERYYLYRRRPDAVYGRDMPRILVVTPQFGRAQQVQMAVMDLARERREPPLPVYVTTLDDIWLPGERSEGTLRPRRGGNNGPGRPMDSRMWPGLRVWRRVDDFGKLVHCFEGLGQIPDGTQRGLDLYRLGREAKAHSHRSRAQQRRRHRENQEK